MPKRGRLPGAFRLQRKAVALTWSCPVDKEDNPIPNVEFIRDELLLRYGPADYCIAEEHHENGKRHYHAYFKFGSMVDSDNCNCMDITYEDYRVHANIDSKPPGKGWVDYVKKKGAFISNIVTCNYKVALSMPTASEALDYLWKNKPADMCKFAHNIEQNIAKRFRVEPTGVVYPGPYPKHYYPLDWDPDTMSLLIWGPPRLWKTQFAMYYLAHVTGKTVGYAKSNVESLKDIDLTQPWVFDEVNLLDLKPDVSREITGVEQLGVVPARYGNIKVLPQVPRIFLANKQFPFRNPDESVYDRRLVSLHIPKFDALCSSQQQFC